jgi:hypothetical protein
MKKEKPAVQRKGKEKAPSGPVFVFPGPEGWESWSVEGGAAQCVGPAETPQKLRPPAGATVALPSRLFFSVPLWIPVEEGIPARDLAKIALESKNLLGANPESAIWAMESIRTERIARPGQDEPGTRQLEACVVLSSAIEEECILEQAGRYEVAGRVLPPPGGGTGVVLRKELGRWVLDFYVGNKWFHTQPLLARVLDAGAAAELRTLLAQLEGEGILQRLDLLVFRGDEAEAGSFLSLLPCVSHMEPRMSPRLSASPWDLQPPILTERRMASADQAKKKKYLRAGILIYLGVVVSALAYFLLPYLQLKALEGKLRAIQGDAEKIREASMAWREAGALVNPKMNAFELLWQVSRPLIEKDPGEIEGVRLTAFEYNAKHVFLTGEGKDLEQTEKYFAWVKKEPMLSAYQWNHPQPRLLPNGNAQFQLEGVPLGAASGEGQEGGQDANANAP